MQKWLKIVTCFPVFMSFIWLEGMDDAKNKKALISWAMASRQGSRSSMEDATSIVKNFNGNASSVFLELYDGHGGKDAAVYAKENLAKKFQEKLKACSTIEDALQQTFSSVDAEIQEKWKDFLSSCGTTALVAYLKDNEVHFAWAGDSRALVIRDGKVIFSTRDHKPDNPEEKERIERAGGHVVYSNGVARVDGNMAVARALGDHFDKYTWGSPISAVPDIGKVQLNAHDVMVFGCDGVWDQFNNDEVAFIIQSVLSNSSREELVDDFIKKGKILLYYGQSKEILAYIDDENSIKKGIADQAVLDEFKALAEKFKGDISSYRREPAVVAKEFITKLETKNSDTEEMSESGDNADLARAAKTIRDFAYALSKQNFTGDNVSVIVARKE